MSPLKCRALDFQRFGDHCWLNAASEGPLPKISAKALKEAIDWKSKPYLLDNKFSSVCIELKQSIGNLIHAQARDIVLGNSASYGIHLLANGIKWNKGDEILVMQNDFPTDILPWLALEKQGVKVIQIKPKDKVLTAEELLENITARTKLFCITHVHTFSGYTLAVSEFSKICKKHNIIYVLNISQSAGNIPIDVVSLGADAVVCAGYKWLLGPYGTGFCWMTPQLLESLELNSAYWIASLSNVQLQSEDVLELKSIKGTRKFDVFGTANFFNFVPFKASIDYLLSLGIKEICNYNQNLINVFCDNLDLKKFKFISPVSGSARSALVVISHLNSNKNQSVFELLNKKHIHTAFWKGNIRISPHVYNSDKEILQVCKVLNSLWP